jgi:hypothetical protein
MLRNLKRIAAGVSLLMLALGFALLGILSFLNRARGATGMEENCCLAGSAVSVVAGAIFLAAAWIYWRRRAEESPGAGEDQ